MEKVLEKADVCTFCRTDIEAGEKVWVEGDKSEEGPSIACAECFWGEKPIKLSSEQKQIDALRKEISEVLNSNTRMKGELEGWRSLMDTYSDEVKELRQHIETLEGSLERFQELARSNRKVVKGLFAMVQRMARDIAAVKPTGEEGTLSMLDELIKIREEAGI